jgi:hypothetical protein
MSYFPGMQKGNLDSVKADAHGKIKKETVTLQGVSVTRVTFDVGCRRNLCWNLFSAVSGRTRILDQAARSIGSLTSLCVNVCHPSTLRMVI